ncbi:hypothetical protein [Methylococcus sp. EFPC2]|uniref:hypothetical protein n=1 Tax=Methylococcus sp. EFPC2 TaxID=2812648 RepID=UPI001966F39B|nr:hypothetical protein [Methylococcus sp. EFPC2]QSA97340.1 hypothetical protein JWZ97_00345 [Methylococcus sp. EFPC2]
MSGLLKFVFGPLLPACVVLCLVALPVLAVEPEVGDENIGVETDNGDAEAEPRNYEERVRQMQEWLHHRRVERESGWAQDVVSAPSPSDEDEDESEDGDEEDGSDSPTDYFSGQGLDERGFRRLEGNLRVRIRGLQGEPAHVISLGRHSTRRGKKGRVIELKAGPTVGHEKTHARAARANKPVANGRAKHDVPAASPKPATKPQSSKKNGAKTKRR